MSARRCQYLTCQRRVTLQFVVTGGASPDRVYVDRVYGCSLHAEALATEAVALALRQQVGPASPAIPPGFHVCAGPRNV